VTPALLDRVGTHDDRLVEKTVVLERLKDLGEGGHANQVDLLVRFDRELVTADGRIAIRLMADLVKRVVGPRCLGLVDCIVSPPAPLERGGDVRTPNSQESDRSSMETPWSYAQEFIGVAGAEEVDYNARWRDRDNPCRSAYYLYGYNGDVLAQRNLIVSNLGLLAKSDARGRLMVTVTNLASAQGRSGVTLQLRNFQNQPIGLATSDGNGMATIEPTGTPFLLVADSGSDRGYLRLGEGNALPVSHFDVGGETVQKGLKGAIYGERGVWRPGDALPLTFVVHDRDGTLPENHPATLELRCANSAIITMPMPCMTWMDRRAPANPPR
jgi:hypothetical protein